MGGSRGVFVVVMVMVQVSELIPTLSASAGSKEQAVLTCPADDRLRDTPGTAHQPHVVPFLHRHVGLTALLVYELRRH
ncbi:hypothetical protein E2C01_004068 [Portunus trituberculatus]|uniref:Secreted protein n=1 Tax=Portunus trituberculatus TaxID=210409 RepID=A0A5B7CRV7_PORTR|nr:hypothetical protein [Portunus trituberculatus]